MSSVTDDHSCLSRKFTQNNFKEGTNLENELENIKKLIYLEQNLKNQMHYILKKKLNKLKKNEYEDEDENNVKKLKLK